MNFLIEVSLVCLLVSNIWIWWWLFIHLLLQNGNHVFCPFFLYCHQNVKIVWGFKGYQYNYNLAQYITITLAKIKGILNAMCVVCCSEEKWYLVVRTYELLSAFVGLFPDLSFFKREAEPMPGICLVQCFMYYRCRVNTSDDFILLAE